MPITQEHPAGEIKSGKLTRQNISDAGQDIHASEAVLIPARSRCLVSTGLVIHIPHGYVGLIWPRSGLSVRYGLETGAGCIDSGYHGEVMVNLYNHGNEDYQIEAGARIAQLLTLPVNLTAYRPVSEFSKTSERGTNGFGSTGIGNEADTHGLG